MDCCDLFKHRKALFASTASTGFYVFFTIFAMVRGGGAWHAAVCCVGSGQTRAVACDTPMWQLRRGDVAAGAVCDACACTCALQRPCPQLPLPWY